MVLEPKKTDWPAGMVQTYADGGRWVAEELGFVDDSERVAIPDQVPPGTPAP